MAVRSRVAALLVAAAAVLPDSSSVDAANAWINEFHYRNYQEDVGTFVEIVGPCGEEAYEYEIVLYQGRDGTQVKVRFVETSVALTYYYRLLIQTFYPRRKSWDGLHEAKSLTGHYFSGQDEGVDNGHCYLVIDIPSNDIRNGKRVSDGIALTRNNVCIQFISGRICRV